MNFFAKFMIGIILLLVVVFLIYFYFPRKIVYTESKAYLITSDQNLKISFDFNKKDQILAQQLSQKLAVDNTWEKGISLELDSTSAAQIAQITPLTVQMKLADNLIKFENNNQKQLSNSLPKNNLDFGTGSAKLTGQVQTVQDFDLVIVEPETVLNFASSSGKIRLSDKLLPLFPILAKIARIELSVHGKSVSGEINLR
jgi:hypothetical protein